MREQATKKNDNQASWPRNGGGTVVPYGTGWPCHFAVHRAMGSSLCTVEGICEDGMEARLFSASLGFDCVWEWTWKELVSEGEWKRSQIQKY